MFLYIVLSCFALLIAFLGVGHDSLSSDDNTLKISTNYSKSKINQTATSILTIVFFIILWFLTAFRAQEIGNDTRVYLEYFDIFSNYGIDTGRTFELGYQALNVLIGKFTSSHHTFLIIISSLIYFGTLGYIVKDSKNVQISICLFFATCFSLYASVLRQSLAVVISLYGYLLLKRDNKLFAGLLFLAATLFHSSAICCFLLFFHPKWYKNQIIVIALVFVGLLLTYSGLLARIVGSITPRYSHYYSSRYVSSGWLAVSYSLIKSLLLYYIFSRKMNYSSNDLVRLSSFVLLVVFSSFGYSVNLFTRASYYFDIILINEIPNLLIEKKMQNRKTIAFLVCCISVVMFLLVLVLRPEWNHLYPYAFWPYAFV